MKAKGSTLWARKTICANVMVVEQLATSLLLLARIIPVRYFLPLASIAFRINASLELYILCMYVVVLSLSNITQVFYIRVCFIRSSGLSQLHGQTMCSCELRTLEAHTSICLLGGGIGGRIGESGNAAGRLRKLHLPRASHAHIQHY